MQWRCATARICREASGRVSTNVFVRDLDLGAPVSESRLLEIVVGGLPLFGGVQLAVDTTLVSTQNCDTRISGRGGPGNCEASQGRQVSRTVPDWWCLQEKLLAVTKTFIRHLAKVKARGCADASSRLGVCDGLLC